MAESHFVPVRFLLKKKNVSEVLKNTFFENCFYKNQPFDSDYVFLKKLSLKCKKINQIRQIDHY